MLGNHTCKQCCHVRIFRTNWATLKPRVKMYWPLAAGFWAFSKLHRGRHGIFLNIYIYFTVMMLLTVGQWRMLLVCVFLLREHYSYWLSHVS